MAFVVLCIIYHFEFEYNTLFMKLNGKAIDFNYPTLKFKLSNFLKKKGNICTLYIFDKIKAEASPSYG